MREAIPNDSNFACALYATNLLISECSAKVLIDLPCIGADGLDPEMTRYLAPDVPFEQKKDSYSEIEFRFYAFKNGKPWVNEADKKTPIVKRYLGSTSNDYVIISPTESPPYAIQYNGMINGDPERTPKHTLSPAEAVALGSAITHLTPIPF